MRVMNYQETVNYLKSYKDLFYRLEWLNNKIKGIKSISYENSSIGSYKTLNDYLDETYQIEKKMATIEDLIGKTEDYKQSLVLRYKFLEFMTLEEVANEMNYSLSQVKRYYREGLKKISSE